SWSSMVITVGPDDNIWYAAPYVNDLIGRITPDGQIGEFPVPDNAFGSWGATWITNGPDGNLWFEATNANAIGRINPYLPNDVNQYQVFPVPSHVRGITAGPDGNMWMT